MDTMVSIIIPAYNVEKYISDTLETVKNQTYGKWECIVVDDCSDDDTGEIIKTFCRNDERFQYIRLNQNSGAAKARNVAISKAGGKYLAFLDSDDIWVPEKLEKQIGFMEENGYDFTCTSYGKIDGDGVLQNRVMRVKKNYDYLEILKNCPGNSTIIYNCHKIGKVYADDIRKRNDFVMWLKVIKKVSTAYGFNEVLTYHRERSGSISHNKANLLKYQWMVYRKIEELSVGRSIWLMIYKMKFGLMEKIRTGKM